MINDTFAKHYDKIYANKLYEEESAMIAQFLNPGKLMNVMDIGCGSGMHGKYLWKTHGYDVHGIEPNEILAEKAGDRLSGELHVTDIENFDTTNRKYDNAICMFQVINYVTNPGILIAKASQIVEEGGTFIIEALDPDFNGKRVAFDLKFPEFRIAFTRKMKDVYRVHYWMPFLFSSQTFDHRLYSEKVLTLLLNYFRFNVTGVWKNGMNMLIVSQRV
jgi:SAM-dependent methyltransferase